MRNIWHKVLYCIVKFEVTSRLLKITDVMFVMQKKKQLFNSTNKKKSVLKPVCLTACRM